MNKYLAMLLGCALPFFLAAQTDPIPVRVLAAGGDQQTVVVNEVLDEPFVVQVLHAGDGTPMPNVALDMWINFPVCIPTPIPCNLPPTEAYGTFVGNDIPGSGVTVVTDKDGLATAPPFRAGTLPGNYSVGASLKLSADQPGGVEYAGQRPDLLALFRFQQLAGQDPSVMPIPGLGRPALVLLVLTLIAVAATNGRLRRRV